jgi:molybdopterin-guanine dinucleotide biosynthesis protein A
MVDPYSIQGYLLTMGRGAGTIELAEALAAKLRRACSRVTVLGPDIVLGADQRIDEAEPICGPLVSLGEIPWALQPVFVLSTEFPAFNPGIISALIPLLGDHLAVVPEHKGKAYPLCALYSPKAFSIARRLVASGERRVSAWLDHLDPVIVQVDLTRFSECFRSEAA